MTTVNEAFNIQSKHDVIVSFPGDRTRELEGFFTGYGDGGVWSQVATVLTEAFDFRVIGVEHFKSGHVRLTGFQITGFERPEEAPFQFLTRVLVAPDEHILVNPQDGPLPEDD